MVPPGHKVTSLHGNHQKHHTVKCYDQTHLKYYNIGETWGRIHTGKVEQCTCTDSLIVCQPVRYTAPEADCYQNSGTDYRGIAGTTISGSTCLPWNSDILGEELHVESVGQAHALGLGGHAFCSPLKSSVQIVLGQHYFNDTGRNAVSFQIEKYVFYDQYSVFNPTQHDIVLIKLKKNNMHCARRSQFVQPLCLPENDLTFPDHHCCHIAGWGHMDEQKPNEDCLLLLVYKDKSDKTKGHKERSSVTLEDICGLDPGLSYEGMSHTMAIICLTQAVMLGFENKETMYAWDVRIRYSLGEVHRFHVVVLPGTKLESGPATLHLCNDHLILVRDVPPTIIGQWKLSDLRRYGAVPNGFVFEGGTRCGYWAGVFFLACAEGEQLSFLFDCIVRGISPTRGPFGLRPVLPDPNANPANMEDRVTHETLELEKRLSLLSHSSRQSSTASTSSYGASVALGDDRSLSSSSSDTSHSDTSIGSRLAMWPEPSLGSASMESHELAAVKSMHPGEEKMYAEVMRGSRPPPKPPRPRKPHEIVRQSSSDSGIATGSHSSYSGSFSSYAGSLDICHADEFGSLLSLPLNFASDQNLCTCQHGEHPRAVGSEYQVPSSLKHLYDTPRSLLQAATAREAQCKSSVSTLLKDQGTSTLLQSATDTNVAVPAQRPDRGLAAALSDYGSTRDSDETYVDYVPRWSVAKQQGEMLECKSSEVAPSADVSTDPCEIYSPQPGVTRALFTVCPVCGGLKVQ
ncbi:Protein Dok-7 [Acipenser ruthenus]|uniref:Protein Dok-7 n=1 Tax=Acipenser ruthenus TaxID=7906 RepID=A0A662YZ32_ACIRT|nr:Protein Dok-7 [Acipenser ruthenus]